MLLAGFFMEIIQEYHILIQLSSVNVKYRLQ